MLTAQEIVEQLQASHLWNEKTKANGTYIESLNCPECGKPEAFAYMKSPLAIICHRNNKCGETTGITRVFPDLLASIEKRYPATNENPNLPAEKFLSIRGIETALQRLRFKYVSDCRGLRAGGILFYVGTNSKGKEVWNGRIFNPQRDEQKGHGYGAQEDLYWSHPGINYDHDAPCYVTEGIIDALSLIEMGHQAIAILAAKRSPANVDLTIWKNLIFAFDNDPAGWSAHKAWKKAHQDALNMCLPSGDWNDLLTHKDSTDAAKWIADNRDELFFLGRLATSPNAHAYAQEFFEHKDRPAGLFPWGGRYYYSSVSQKKKEPEVSCYSVSNFTINVISYLLDNSNPDEPTYRFNLEVAKAKGAPARFTATANELSSAGQMTTLFLQRANAVWSGEKAPVVALLNRITTSRAPIVRQLQTKGYDPESGGYVFRSFMIDQSGKLFMPDQDTGIFDVGTRRFLRGAALPDIIPTSGTPIRDIYNLLIDAWGERAALGIAWTVASWFCMDVKAKIRQFPFLSFYGEPGTGKSNLMILLNALQCIDEEGHQLKGSDTAVGIVRMLSQRHSLFKGIIETDKTVKTKFDFRFVLGGYNDNPLQIKGIKSTDNRTETLKLRSGICFAANQEPWDNKPQRERVLSARFMKDFQDQKSKTAFDRLRDIPVSDFGNFYLSVMQQHRHFKAEWFDMFTTAKRDLRQYLTDHRINENHATVLCFHRLLEEHMGIQYPLEPYLAEIGIEKQRKCSEESGALSEYFFDLVLGIPETDYRDDFGLAFSKSKEKNEIAIHLPGLLKAIDRRGYKLVASTKELKEALEAHSAFSEAGVNKKFWYDGQGTTQRAMTFRYDGVVGTTACRYAN